MRPLTTLCACMLLAGGCEPRGEAPTARGETPPPKPPAGVPAGSAVPAVVPLPTGQSDDPEKAKLTEAWIGAHRPKLWRLAESLPQLRGDIEDRGFGASMRPAETVGHAVARQRREARGRDYFENIACVARRDGDYDCSVRFGRSGASSDVEFAVNIELQVHPDATLASGLVVCSLSG